jgi:phage regulator Rha-like protein
MELPITLPEDVVLSKIYLIRGKKVILDRDLALLYEMETRRLKEQVRRNMERFPDDFMFELSSDELQFFREQYGETNREIMGLRIAPFAFTEHGILMLASVLNSNRAIQINIQIVRIFNRMREVLKAHGEMLEELGQIKSQLAEHENKFLLILEYLKQFEEAKQQEFYQYNRPRIGFIKPDKL